MWTPSKDDVTIGRNVEEDEEQIGGTSISSLSSPAMSKTLTLYISVRSDSIAHEETKAHSHNDGTFIDGTSLLPFTHDGPFYDLVSPCLRTCEAPLTTLHHDRGDDDWNG